MSRLHQIQKLDIGSNDIEDLPEVIGTMTNLTELWADSNCISEIHKVLNLKPLTVIGKLKKLACLDLSKNNIREIPSEIGKCTNLIDVTLTHNSFSMIPDSFTKLKNLSTLRIDCNCVSQFPEDIGKLKNLQELSAIGNMLESLPPSIGLLRKLHTLYLDDNDILELPIEIGSCISLTVLSVAKNKLANVPSEVGHLSKLKMLNLTSNLIRNLPLSILGLTNLGTLWLAHGQNKPLVALNREIDPSGRHVVTCCLLPQLPAPVLENGESDEDVPRRSQRKIRFQGEIEPHAPEKPGLVRVPTPYPKELRDLAEHALQNIQQAKGQNEEVVNYSNEPMYKGDMTDAVQHSDKEYGVVLSDKNSNMTSAKPPYSIGAGDSSNANAHLPLQPDQRILDNQMQSLQPMERNRQLPGPTANIERWTGNSKEFRIPVKGSNSIADFNISNSHKESKINRTPSYHGYTSPNSFMESGKSLAPPPRPVPEPQLPPSSKVPAQSEDLRESRSRIPKSESPRTVPEESSSPSRPADDGKLTATPSSRYPSIHSGKGIYVVATDSEDLPVQVGDKILQVDGIDVGETGVEIVNKILDNCPENIQLLVSRQH